MKDKCQKQRKTKIVSRWNRLDQVYGPSARRAAFLDRAEAGVSWATRKVGENQFVVEAPAHWRIRALKKGSIELGKRKVEARSEVESAGW